MAWGFCVSGEAGAVGVGGDLGVDFEGEGESGAAGGGGHAGLGAVADGVEEVFKLEAKGFAFGDVGPGEGEAGGGVRGRRRSGRCGCRRCVGAGDGCGDDGGIDGDGEEFLAGEVEREVLMGLEEAQLADLLGGDAGGGEVGDAAGVELEADVGDVGFAREDGQADGADFLDGRVGEGEDDVEVVNHEVEDDVDVEGARGEDAEAVSLKEHGVVERGESRGDGGIEAL